MVQKKLFHLCQQPSLLNVLSTNDHIRLDAPEPG